MSVGSSGEHPGYSPIADMAHNGGLVFLLESAWQVLMFLPEASPPNHSDGDITATRLLFEACTYAGSPPYKLPSGVFLSCCSQVGRPKVAGQQYPYLQLVTFPPGVLSTDNISVDELVLKHKRL